nr:hypothetical protein [Tanacetum cinerariifolium]
MFWKLLGSGILGVNGFEAAWPKVLASKKNGGLGVSSFYALNRALLLKWIWRFTSQDGSLWYRVIKALYGPSIESHPIKLSSNWCAIVQESHVLAEKGFNFLAHCKKRIGNGSGSRFWFDKWLGDRPLKDVFSRLFALELNKEISVAGKVQGGIVNSFRRPVRTGVEGQQLVDITSLLSSVSLSLACDRWVCDISGDGEFRVKEVKRLFGLFGLKFLLRRRMGGLGVSSFYALNRALLLKWIWRFTSQDGSLWYRVIKALYGPSIESHPIKLSSNWCVIVQGSHVLAEKGFNFLAHCKKRIGNGSGSRFWFDKWLGDRPLKDVFSRLFALELNKEISVAGKVQGGIVNSFRRPVRTGVKGQQLVDITSLLSSVSFSLACDRWVCDIYGDGEFRVKEVRSLIDNLFLPRFPEATRWVRYVPIKINVFAWRARRDFLPTRSNLVRRGIALDSPVCLLCLSSEEDGFELLFGMVFLVFLGSFVF